MKNKIILKDRMERSEMKALHEEWYPFLTANAHNMGQLAKHLGYVRVAQKINKEYTYFYVKKELIEKRKTWDK